MITNRGYDVWLGNNRGNKHSRNHTKYNPDKNIFRIKKEEEKRRDRSFEYKILH